MKIFTCEFCGKKYKRMGKNPKSRFCSIKCKAEWQSKYNTGKNHPRWRDDYVREKICQYCGKTFTSVNPTTLQKQKFCSKECADKGGIRYKGKDHPNWKGLKSEVDRLRGQKEYINWSRAIMKRDDYTCQLCGKRGGDLHAHHLKSFTYYPKLRYLLCNGKTLCVSCHAKIHRPDEGSDFKGIIENEVNSVELFKRQYRAKLSEMKESVEVNPGIMDTKAPAGSQPCKI